MSREYRAVSKLAKGLIDKQEGNDVDYKRDISGLDVLDLVAFANSETGGTILIGVDEVALDNGCQRGEIVGCKVGDQEKQSILSKAESCTPPVQVEINIENTEGKPFFRIVIPSGQDKPYSTSRGTYVIRGDGRTTPLQPSEIVAMYLDTKGQILLNKSSDATVFFDQTIRGIDELNKKVGKIDEHILKIAKNINKFNNDIQP